VSLTEEIFKIKAVSMWRVTELGQEAKLSLG